MIEQSKGGGELSDHKSQVTTIRLVDFRKGMQLVVVIWDKSLKGKG